MGWLGIGQEKAERGKSSTYGATQGRMTNGQGRNVQRIPKRGKEPIRGFWWVREGKNESGKSVERSGNRG